MVPPSLQGLPDTLERQPQRATPSHESSKFRVSSKLLWLLVPATLCLGITRQSLWIDEGFTVWFASHRSFHSFFTALIGTRGSAGDPQLIFYLLHVWTWIKVFGSSELSLRAANVPFALLFIGAMGWASRRLFWHPNLWALFCLSPFFWFYLNEARPYAALIAFSSVASIALIAYLVDPVRYGRAAPWYCLIALLLAWGSHILAAFLFSPLTILVVITLIETPNLRSAFWRDWRRPALLCLPGFLALGTFYVWVSAYGVNKTEGQPGLANLAYALYEFTGFAGLGPPRNEIRQSRSLAVFGPYWPWLLLGVMVLFCVAFTFFRARSSKLVRNLFLSLLLGLAAALGISVHEQFQVLGRHLAVFFPLLLMPVMLYPKGSLSPKTLRGASATLVALGLLWGLSDLRLVFMNRYSKDAYREACSSAATRAARDGAEIVWAADPFTARYYGVLVSARNRPYGTDSHGGIDLPVHTRAVDPQGWSRAQAQAFLDSSPAPVILVLSKADPFDQKGTWRSLIEERRPQEIARLNAFSIYEWQAKLTNSDRSAARTSPTDVEGSATHWTKW